MIQLLCVHAAAAVLAPLLFKSLGRRGFGLLTLVPASAALWAIANSGAVHAGRFPEQRVSWVPELGLNLAFRLDVLSWAMVLIVGGVGSLILVYCWGYFGRQASNLGRFGGVFIAFAGAMFGLVTADNTVLVYLFWELTTVFSFLLIGHYHERQPSRMAAMQAITVTTLGGLAMLVGIVILGIVPGGSFRLSELIPAAANGSLGLDAHPALVPTAVALVLLGALTKSAQVPFHFWLPAAMAAPTPVSGYLHAAAMVKAGVYLVARMAPGFEYVDLWQPTIVTVGLITMVVGGYRALRQFDLKLMLAFGTVSQLGFILVLVGHGDSAVALAGLAMLCAHAMFKASLFLTVGAIDHELGTRDLRELSGVGRALPGLMVSATLAAASMAGLPPLLGYVGKEAALHAFVVSEDWLVLGVVILGSILTMAYTLRFWWGAFANKRGVDPVSTEHRLDLRLIGPIAVLAAGGLVAGLLPGLMERLLAPHANDYPGEAGHLTLWGGFGIPIAATALIIAAGVLLFVQRVPVARFQSRFQVRSADGAYRRVIRVLNTFSADVTAFVQTGSLPAYLSVMLMTMVGALALVTIFGTTPELGPLRLWDTPLQAAIVVLACVATVLVVRSRRRMKAVLLMAFVGYSTAVLFALQGAPDLALTQALVETVTLVVFVLVLRRLPPYFSNRPYVSSRVRRVIIGALVGTSVALLGWVTASARIHPPVTVDYPGEVLNFGYGRNIVNVTLVDTRAWDTLGEISVLLAAATGVASLVFIRDRAHQGDLKGAIANAFANKQVWAMRRDSRLEAENYLARGKLIPPSEPLRPERRGVTWLPGVATLSPVRRSLVFEIGARLVFHPLILFSIFLLFSGHNNPGGGFAGGILAGISLVIRYLAGGRYELVLATRVRPGTLLGLGMFIATTAAIFPVLLGGTILQTTVFDLVLPIFNEVHLATALFFDMGVYLIVVGLVLDILTSLGAEVDRQSEAEGDTAPELAPGDTRDVPDEIEVGEDLRSETSEEVAR